jgi:hypothetical protein
VNTGHHEVLDASPLTVHELVSVVPQLITVVLADLPALGSAGDGEVVKAGDAEYGLVDAVAFHAAVAEDLPGLHAGEGVLDAGSDLAVRTVGLLIPGREFDLAAFTAVWDDQTGAAVAAVRDHCGMADSVLRTGQFPRLVIVSVARDRPADSDDEPGVGVDDDLVVGGVPVVLRLLGDGMVQVGTRVPSTISTVPSRNRLRCWSASGGPRWSMMRSAADFDTPNNGANCRRARFIRQYAATSRTRSSRGRLHGLPLRTGSAPSRRSAVISLPNCRGLSPVNGAIHEGSDVVITPAMQRIISVADTSPCD